jgi:hypothetical protein
MEIGLPEEVSGCFLTKLEVANFASGFSKAAKQLTEGKRKDTTILAVMLSGNRRCAEKYSQERVRKASSYQTT